MKVHRFIFLLCASVLTAFTVSPVFADAYGSGGESRWKSHRADSGQNKWQSGKFATEGRNSREGRTERNGKLKPAPEHKQKEKRVREPRQTEGKWQRNTEQRKSEQRKGTRPRHDGNPLPRRDDKKVRDPRHPDRKWSSEKRNDDRHRHDGKPLPRREHKPHSERHRNDRKEQHHRERRRAEHRHDQHRHDRHRHEHHYRHKHPRWQKHDRHRPRYKYYRRHKHVYYRDPWYSTWFLAPVIWHFHSIGYELLHLPTGYVRISVGGLPYFYFDGVFYQSYRGGYVTVAAPLGAYV